MDYITIIFTKYDVTCEFLMLLLSFLLLTVMAASKPQVSKMYRTATVGLHLCAAAIILHLGLLYYTCFPQVFNRTKFYILYCIYIVVYITILNVIYAYVNLLSFKHRERIGALIGRVLAVSVFYFTICLYPVFANKLVITYSNRNVILTQYQYAVELCGVICALFTLGTTFVFKKYMSRVVFSGVLIFTPIEILLLLIQPYFKTVYFISFTYVMPFLLMFMLFHCSKFNDVIGCQNIVDIDARLRSYMKHHNRFVLIQITFPQLQKREYSDINSIVLEGASKKCREIEDLSHHQYIYTQNPYTYTLIARVRNQEKAELLAEKIRGIISEPFFYAGHNYKVCYKQLVVTSNKLLSDPHQYISMIGYMSDKFNKQFENEYLIAGSKDYLDFHMQYIVEQAVVDIRAKNNLNDERVVAFIQPIHCVETNSYRTGEALLRLKIDGELIPPDMVIHVAEMNNCIHQLTMIMLNKICHQIKLLELQNFDFDAITVNCSTAELADPDFHKEVMNIVFMNQINPRHLRLEITESTTIDNFDTILFNMKTLNANGITFYLDDFGTGYSNMERIMNLPLSTIKFDKSILYTALSHPKSDRLVRMLVRFFKNNGLKLVVEGVEDLKQYNYCKEIGFDYVQGFLFSRPNPAAKIENYFARK